MWSALSYVILLSSVISAQDVRMPPYITAQGTTTSDKYGKFDKIFRLDDTIELECKAAGVPPPEYTWIKNGAPLNMNTPGITRTADGTISIGDAGSLSQGYYQCQASNMYGKTMSMTYVLKRAVLDSGASSEILTVTVMEGESIKLTANPPKCNPKPTYSWELATSKVDDKPTSLTPSKRIMIDDFGNLWFAYVTKEDSFNGAKIYKSTVYNPIMDIKSGGSYTNLTVLSAPGGLKEYPPVEKFSPQTPLIAVEKRTVEMKCIFSGNPEPVVQWTRPTGLSLPLGRITTDDFGAKLTISNVSSADEGDYICTANNRNGRADKIIQINVQAAPEFRSLEAGPHNKNVTEGQDFVVNCDAHAKPEAKVEWFLNAEKLNLKELPPKFSLSSNGKTLTVRSVCKDCPPGETQRPTDLMVIQCNASNFHGYAFGSGYLNVLLPTKATITGDDPYVKIEAKSERTLRYECNAESDPSTPVTPKWYNITNPDKVEVLHSEPPEITVTGGVLTIRIAENTTERWLSYGKQFKCVVDNGYSKAEQVVTLEPWNKPQPVMASFMDDWWWLILLLVFILFLIFILILCCCLYLMRNKGDKYDVDEKERQNGNDPVKELTDKDFQDYKRPDERGMKGSQGSMASLCASSVKLNSDEEASLNDYGDDPGRFAEDGSFLGVYTGDQK